MTTPPDIEALVGDIERALQTPTADGHPPNVVQLYATDLAALVAAYRSLSSERDRLVDKVEGLDADLYSAVEVAYLRGATDWTRLNYPVLYARFREFEALSTIKEGE